MIPGVLSFGVFAMHKMSFEIHRQEAPSGGKVLPWLAIISLFVLALFPLMLGLELLDAWIG